MGVRAQAQQGQGVGFSFVHLVSYSMVGSISAGGAQPPVMGQSNLGQDTRGLPGMSPARGEYRRMGKVGWGVGGGW